LKSTLRLLFVVLASGCGSDGSSSGGGVPAGGSLPAGWTARDVGSTGQPGRASHDGGVFSLEGSGADIWGAADAFQFSYAGMSGDGEIVARVISLDPTDAWAKAGVMIRESLAADSKFAMTVATPANGALLQFREATGGNADLVPGLMMAAPLWVRLSRSGSTFSAALSSDGIGWTSVGGRTIAMAADVLVGLCLTSHTNATTARAAFDHVTLGGAVTPPPPASGSITASSPESRIVYQRNNANTGLVRIAGTCAGVSRVEARLVARQGGTSTDWTTIDDSTPGAYSGSLAGSGGWYQLEIRGFDGASVVATTSVDRVGIGEVFVVVGHSVAHTGVDNIAGASDDRANTIPLLGGATQDNYTNTGDPQHLPRAFGHYGSGVSPAPFGGNNYFWARFAEVLAQRKNVPVIVYNAAFGGTSLEHWAKSSQGIQFEHGFVKSSIRMPYINLYNALKTLVQPTGVRAILADQGANDWPNPDEDQVLGYYQTFVNQARADLGHGSLAIVVNRATPFMTVHLIRRVQERMIGTSSCFAGPDYDTLAPEDRYDGTHLSLAGQSKAAQMWSDALTDGFFASSQPWIP
jgi:hypothetical protein